MNKTRREWSSAFKCCKDKRDSLTAFYSTASAVFAIFISFYGAVYYFGSKYTATETLDAREILRSRDAVESLPRPAGSSQSSSSSTGNSKKLIINEDDSSDDEPLLTKNRPAIDQNTTNLITLDN